MPVQKHVKEGGTEGKGRAENQKKNLSRVQFQCVRRGFPLGESYKSIFGRRERDIQGKSIVE